MARCNGWPLIRWCKWLWRVGLPTRHIAILFDLEPSDVEECLGRRERSTTPVEIPAWWSLGDETSRRPIKGQTASHVRMLHWLDYGAARIAEILVLDPKTVRDFLRRSTPVRKNALVKVRTQSEQQRLDHNRRRAAKGAAVRAARALWSRCAAPLDDAGCRVAIVPTADELLELVFEPETPPPRPVEPTRWDQTGHQRTRWGEESGQAKLTRELAAEIRQDHAAGVSMYELARRHDVAKGTIAAIVAGRTWLEPPPDAARDDERPPVPPPADDVDDQVVGTKAKRRRWRASGGTPKLGARGSGALHDDD